MGGWWRKPLTSCALVCLRSTCPAAWLQGQGVACQEARAQGSKVIFQTGVSTRWLRTQLHRTEKILQVDDAFDPSPKCPQTLLFLVCAQKLLNINITDKYSLVILWLAFFENRTPLRNCSNYFKFQFERNGHRQGLYFLFTLKKAHISFCCMKWAISCNVTSNTLTSKLWCQSAV